MRPIPRAPLVLGTGGIVPFAVLAALLWALPAGYAPLALKWLLGYSAVILSFVGALHWGIALVHPEVGDRERSLMMSWSVVPALAGWVALELPPASALTLMAVMFVVQLGADIRLVRRFPVTPWYLRLRGGLTAGVVTSLFVATLYVIGA
ncbi:MAG: DUF3429 domain-containing protein [Gammaproteobacteria bacterium]|nr:DUF3429 domain-containing protein [Gammaproteobacteria bacterium]